MAGPGRVHRFEENYGSENMDFQRQMEMFFPPDEGGSICQCDPSLVLDFYPPGEIMKLKKIDDPRERRKKLEEDLEALITEVLKLRYKGICQICEKSVQGHGGQFHVLPKGGLYVNLKYHPANILYAGWFDCHFPFHHDFFKARDIIYPRLVALLGEDFEDRLKAISRGLPKVTETELMKYKNYWENEKAELIEEETLFGENKIDS